MGEGVVISCTRCKASGTRAAVLTGKELMR